MKNEINATKTSVLNEKNSTNLFGKNYSPLIVRKYYVNNWPMFVGIITDVSLSKLDHTVQNIITDVKYKLVDDIQSLRNFCGYVSESLTKYYNNIKKGCVEGIGVVYYVDKLFISSLSGDLMTHLATKQEFFLILNIMPHI